MADRSKLDLPEPNVSEIAGAITRRNVDAAQRHRKMGKVSTNAPLFCMRIP